MSLQFGNYNLIGIASRSVNYTANPGLIGVAISKTLTVAAFIGFAFKTLADTELQMNSVQRIMEYIHKGGDEASWTETKPQANWPEQNTYEAQNVRYKYRPELPEVVKGISFKIKNNEKIGIVGRTGSGKSTITLGLLRMIELEKSATESSFINLSSLDISQIGLHSLRQKTTIIPQDPVMFTGTIRSNIDPFSEFSNSEIVSALEKTKIFGQLKQPEKINKTILGELMEKYKQKEDQSSLNNISDDQYKRMNDDEKRLFMEVNDNGGNLSVGQRQLICMARALVRKSPVLLMDEATANIDEMTDFQIQKMIKEEFINTTVITIAHRLNTIVHYDRLIVLDQGKIKEFDSPKNLMDNPNSDFYKLVIENGQDYFNKLRALIN